MALSFTPSDRQLLGTKRVVTGTVTFDASYVTGGMPFTASNVGLTAITDVTIHDAAATTPSAYFVIWNKSTTAPTLQAYQGDNPNAAQAPALQVPNATNLATLSARYEIWGY